MADDNRSTFYRADRDDETGEIVIHRKRRVNCPDGYETTESEARNALMGRETPPLVINEETGIDHSEEPNQPDEPEASPADASPVLRDDEEAKEEQPQPAAGASDDEPNLGAIPGMLIAEREIMGKMIGKAICRIRLISVRNNYTDFEVEGPSGKARVSLQSGHVQTKGNRPVFFWKKPRSLHPEIRTAAEQIISEEDIRYHFNEIMLEIRSGRQGVIA